MTAPPRVASWLLARAIATSDGDAIAGDLYEEFTGYIVPGRGLTRARWWYRWQVARSLTPLLFRSWERASLRHASVAAVSAGVLVTIPASLLMTLRAFVLQQVPLKATSDLSAGFSLALAVVVLLSGAVGLVAAIRILGTNSRQR